MNFCVETITTPTGDMLVVSDEAGALRALEWVDLQERLERLLTRHYKGHVVTLRHGSAPKKISDALTDYFHGNLNALYQVQVATGGTAFQRRVWTALRDIPAGQTRSYQQIATAIENPKGVRAVGLANGANPIAIAVPCHRVIGANGSLTGYGGGMARKEWLLRHEGAIATLV